MWSIQHNLLAENANRQLNVNTKKNTKITEKLSSGYQINRAADDAAGLAISEKMRRQIRGLHQASENINDGISYVKTAEGALNEVQEILQRMNQLSVQAANGTNTLSDREAINSEIQALKVEMNRIFSTTTFNEQRIWEPEESTIISDYVQRPAVVFTNALIGQKTDVTNENCGVYAADGIYSIAAITDGVVVSWTGYDGNSYNTGIIGWDEIEKNNYSFNIEPKNCNGVALPSGEQLFTYSVSMNVEKGATLDNIRNYLNGTALVASYGTDVDFSLPYNNDVRISSWGFRYAAAYKSHVNSDNGYDFNDANNDFISPGSLTSFPDIDISDLDAAKESTDIWEFAFYLEGVGNVTAKSDSTWVYARDLLDYHPACQGQEGILGSVLAAVTGENSNGDGGLLDDEGVSTNSGGTIYLGFTMTADSTGDRVGSFTIAIRIRAEDTQETVLQKIKDGLKADTILNINATDPPNADSDAILQWKDPLDYLDIPVYDTIYNETRNLYVQAGAEAGQHIEIEYDSLNNRILGIEDTNVLTVEDASNAINEVKAALQTVSEQRSLFGAYQNRLEHAYNINKNVEENTQASESMIRDADIADLMMEYSVNNILMQAGVSMLAQANQYNQTALRLLQ